MRMDTGVMMSPGQWPRRPIRVQDWKWQTKLNFKWKREAHINELELRAGLSSIKWRLRCSGQLGKKFLHVMDSAVSLGVLTKKRSSAVCLQRVIRRVNALELTSGCVVVLGFVRSEANPADAPSRVREAFRKKCRLDLRC